MLPAAFLDASWAPQPDSLAALVSEISRHLALVKGWVPQIMDELVGGVVQRLLLIVVESHACQRHCKYHSWFLSVMLYVACLPYLDSGCHILTAVKSNMQLTFQM
jgi:hypothetical protein